MADKKKMSVADILAAARKSDGEGSDSADVPPAEEPQTQEPAPVEAKTAAVPKSGAGRPGVADMLAMARGEGKGEAEAKPAKAPAKKAAAKPAAKAPSKPAAPVSTGPKDTASILAAARKGDKPGPITKAEAASRRGAEAKSAKPKRIAPPMPAKPDYAKPKVAKAPTVDGERRFTVVALSMLVGSFLAVGFSSLTVTVGLWTLGLARFMFPNLLREPPSRFKVGFAGDFPPGFVETKFKAKYGVWVVNGVYNGQGQIYALMSVCTHLGCTPNWLEAERKFKCPCHGSGFYSDGVNFEGPAPRPLERYAIRIADDGQLEIDKSQSFQQEMGGWEDPASYVSV